MRAKWILAGSSIALGVVVWTFLGSTRHSPTPAPAGATAAEESAVSGSPTSESNAPENVGEASRVEAGEMPVLEVSEVAAPETAPSATLADDLDALAPTFLTATPDVLAFDRALTRLAELAQVDPDSVRTDPHSGVVTGEFALGDGLVRARFTLEGDSASVELTTGVDSARHPGLLLRSVYLGFDADSAGVSRSQATLQFHPDTRQASGSRLEPGVEAYAGWTASATGSATGLRPTAMRAADDGIAWEIGRAETLEPLANPWSVGLAASQVLHAKLRSVR